MVRFFRIAALGGGVLLDQSGLKYNASRLYMSSEKTFPTNFDASTGEAWYPLSPVPSLQSLFLSLFILYLSFPSIVFFLTEFSDRFSLP